MQDRAARSGGESQLHASTVTLLFVVVATVVYFVIPVPGKMRESSWAVLFGAGLIVLALLIMLSIRTLLRATEGVRVRSLIVLLCCAVLFFSWANVALAAIPGQFTDLHTKTDAVYFSVSTLGTVGFGDVHASGQLARAAVTLQMLFNLVFLGTALTFVTGILRQRVQASRRQVAGPGAQSGNVEPPDQGQGTAGGAR